MRGDRPGQQPGERPASAGERVPGAMGLEYGASADFPCGVIPATDPQGRAPAFGRFANYVLRVFVENGRSISCWFRLDIDLCGNVAVTIDRWL